MAFNLDWGALMNAPSIGDAVQKGWQRGRAIAQQGETDNALAAYAAAPSMSALAPLVRSNPAVYSALAQLQAKQDATARTRQATELGVGVLRQYEGANPGGRSAETLPNGDMQVTATKSEPTLADVYRLDPEVAKTLQGQIADLQDEHRKQLAGETDAMANAAYSLLQLPADKRQAGLDAQRAYLKSAGFADRELDDADLTDEGLHNYISHSLGVKSALSQHQQQIEADEKARHDRELEAAASGNLAVSRARLGLEGKREARLTKWGPQPLLGTVRTDTDDLDY